MRFITIGPHIAQSIPTMKNAKVITIDTFLIFITGFDFMILFQLFDEIKCLYNKTKKPSPTRNTVAINTNVLTNANGTPITPITAKQRIALMPITVENSGDISNGILFLKNE